MFEKYPKSKDICSDIISVIITNFVVHVNILCSSYNLYNTHVFVISICDKNNNKLQLATENSIEYVELIIP